MTDDLPTCPVCGERSLILYPVRDDDGQLVEMCADCERDHDDERAGPTVKAVILWPVAAPGVCPACPHPIERGQRIAAMTDGTYWHEGCAS